MAGRISLVIARFPGVELQDTAQALNFIFHILAVRARFRNTEAGLDPTDLFEFCLQRKALAIVVPNVLPIVVTFQVAG